MKARGARPPRERWPRNAGLALVLLVLAAELVTDARVNLSIFYLVPVCLVAWGRGWGEGLGAAALSAFGWCLADQLLHRHAAEGEALLWNAVARFTLLGTVAVLLARLRGLLAEKERAVRELRKALAAADRARAELAQRSEELRRSNAELAQYSAVAAHDLRSPLVAVGGFLQLLQRRLGPGANPDVDRLIGRAREGVQRMQELIDDLLAYARIGAAAAPDAPDLSDCEAALDAALADLGPEIEATSATVERGPLPAVRAGHGELAQLFRNLVGNAVKFRGPAPPRIAVDAERVGSDWVFRVRDNGLGVPPESREEIFGMFKRLPTPSPVPGTGIGLAICKKVVGRLGGRIWVESEPGRGSTFLFTLPAQER